jgi:hypothetical protein
MSALREAFLRRLTVDSDHRDRRRRDYNQAIFMPFEAGGHTVWTGTDLDMVMAAFALAEQDVERAAKAEGGA